MAIPGDIQLPQENNPNPPLDPQAPHNAPGEDEVASDEDVFEVPPDAVVRIDTFLENRKRWLKDIAPELNKKQREEVTNTTHSILVASDQEPIEALRIAILQLKRRIKIQQAVGKDLNPSSEPDLHLRAPPSPSSEEGEAQPPPLKDKGKKRAGTPETEALPRSHTKKKKLKTAKETTSSSRDKRSSHKKKRKSKRRSRDDSDDSSSSSSSDSDSSSSSDDSSSKSTNDSSSEDDKWQPGKTNPHKWGTQNLPERIAKTVIGTRYGAIRCFYAIAS
ncbi:hypothetical protein OC834_007925 [Tilletia horrida]|nr:hypothetical protein OC834_007925 [Tilletia horrida]